MWAHCDTLIREQEHNTVGNGYKWQQEQRIDRSKVKIYFFSSRGQSRRIVHKNSRTRQVNGRWRLIIINICGRMGRVIQSTRRRHLVLRSVDDSTTSRVPTTTSRNNNNTRIVLVVIVIISHAFYLLRAWEERAPSSLPLTGPTAWLNATHSVHYVSV